MTLSCLCTDLLFSISSLKSPDPFCATLKTLIDEANRGFQQSILSPIPYDPTLDFYCTPPELASSSRLKYMDVYVDELCCLTKGDCS